MEATGSPAARRGAAAVAPREQGWGYCTEFLINGPGLDVDAIRTELAALGESALVVGDPELVRVHIHTGDPAGADRRGVLARADEQAQGRGHVRAAPRRAGRAPTLSERRRRRSGPPREEQPQAPPKPIGVASVAPGDGFREIMRSLGADSVVSGGQTMNPSIEDLLNGVRAANAERVILLPNNGNVILTAEQVDPLAEGCEVRVVPDAKPASGHQRAARVRPDGEPRRERRANARRDCDGASGGGHARRARHQRQRPRHQARRCDRCGRRRDHRGRAATTSKSSKRC